MKDFRLFDISDFVMDEDFIRWVHEKNNDDNDFWTNWLRENPDKHLVVAEAKRILESIGTEQKMISEVEIGGEVKRLLDTIRVQTLQPKKAVKLRYVSQRWMSVAAILLVAVACTAFYFFLKQDKALPKYSYAAMTPSKNLVENVNTSGKPFMVTLPDGTTVELASNSRISYANNFNSNETRDVYLLGEAFFNVTKNPGRPFRVFANEIVAKVLGTSFRIRCFEKDSVIRVIVRTGKVSVYSQTATDEKITAAPNHMGGIILTPNQELLYQKSKEKFRKKLLENPVMVLPEVESKNLVYEEAPLEKVFSQLSKIYDISIIYDKELLKNCMVTADLRNESFYNQVMLICKAIGASYEIIDGQAVIQARGCE
jgi:transmembrane sensor